MEASEVALNILGTGGVESTGWDVFEDEVASVRVEWTDDPSELKDAAETCVESSPGTTR